MSTILTSFERLMMDIACCRRPRKECDVLRDNISLDTLRQFVSCNLEGIEDVVLQPINEAFDLFKVDTCYLLNTLLGYHRHYGLIEEKRNGYDYAGLIILTTACVYVQRLSTSHLVTGKNIGSLICVASVFALKYHSDFGCNMNEMACILNVTLDWLIRAEHDFARMMNFRFYIHDSDIISVLGGGESLLYFLRGSV